MKFAFYKASGSFLDKGIRFYMRGDYSHVEAILSENPDGTYECASAVPGSGVRIANITLPASDWDIIEAPGDVVASRAWFETHNGAAYDYIGLFGFVLRPAIECIKNKYWCSQACLESIGFIGAWREDPNSMYDLLSFAETALKASISNA